MISKGKLLQAVIEHCVDYGGDYGEGHECFYCGESLYPNYDESNHAKDCFIRECIKEWKETVGVLK